MLRTNLLVAATAFATAIAVPLWTVPEVGAATARASVSQAASGAAVTGSGGSSTLAGPADGTTMADRSGAIDWRTMDKRMAERDKQFPAATKGIGAQVMKPKVLADGTKEFDLTTKVTKWEVEPGKTVDAWTYNGTVPGPTLRVDVGDKVRVVLNNQLPESTVIHWHGIDIPNDMDGVSDITQDPVKPGAKYTYSFTARRQAVGWYHSHHNGTQQVPNGLYGMIVIGKLPVPEGVKVSQEIPMMLQDAGVIGMSINGKAFPATIPVRAKRGDWIMVHYTNAGTMSHPMHLHGMRQQVIAKDGIPLPQPYEADTVNVAPGERYTVLVHTTEPGKWAWHCHIFPHSEGSQGMFGLFDELIVS